MRMIETHPNPAEAWSDADQQITPQALGQILSQIVVRSHDTDLSGSVELEYLRQQMDSMDAEIIDLMARRMDLSGEIGLVKQICNMTAYQPARWREIVETRGERGTIHGLTKEFIVELYEKIHHESIRIQLSVLESAAKEIKK